MQEWILRVYVLEIPVAESNGHGVIWELAWPWRFQIVVVLIDKFERYG